MGRRARLTAAFALLALLASCGEPPASPEAAEAERLWHELARDPTPEIYKAFCDANLGAAKRHGEMHDRLGVQFRVRGFEAQAAQAARVRDPQERGRMAFEVIDRIDEIENRDLFRIWDESLPGASARLRLARSAAQQLVQ